MASVCALAFSLTPAAASAQQVSEPSSRCVQNCGDGPGSSSIAYWTLNSREANRKRERETQLALDEGIVYYDRGDWSNAIRSFEEALDHTPDDAYIERWLLSTRSQQAAKMRGPSAKGGKIRPVPAVIPPPARPGKRPDRVGGSPAIDKDGVVLGGKG
jgi:tetratricopeptide (TPR) repeat protein